MKNFDGVLQKVKIFAQRSSCWLSTLVFLLGPFACFLMVETLNENDVFTALTPLQTAFNLIWYFSLFLLVRAATGLDRGAAAISAICCFVIGLVNHYVLRIRGRALWPADIAAWRTAMNVADSQDLSLDVFIVLAAIIFVLYLLLLLICPKRADGKKPGWKSRVIYFAVVVIYGVIFFFTNLMPALGLYPQQWETRLNGFALNFSLAARSMIYRAPEVYSKDHLLELSEQYQGEDGSTALQPENVIIVMNESFADFSIYDKFESDVDPLPFYHSLCGAKNTITGTLWSPVWGGGTANVEHEFLTGFSSFFLPENTVAYQLYIHEDTPSMAEAANAAGYETVSFHPYLRSGWNRVQVYDYMDFDRQLYVEDISDPHYVRNYISDLCDYEMVNKLTEEHDGKLFVFNVTMQNHNGYNQDWTNLERTVRLSDQLNEIEPNAEQYFAAIHESDRALKKLLEYYQESDEPTLIVFFGDHQPPLSRDFYGYLTGEDLDKIVPEHQNPLYQTPFLVWANYEIESKHNVNVTPAGLGLMTAELAGLPLTGLQQFLRDFQENIPVIFPAGCIMPDGSQVTCIEELDPLSLRWLQDYEMLVWCGLMDQFPGMEKMYHVMAPDS